MNNEEDIVKGTFFKLVEVIRGLAMDYKIQLTLIPSQIHWALAGELVDEFDSWYHNRRWFLEEGLISEVHLAELIKLNAMIDELIEKDLVTTEAMKESKEWNEIRHFSRKLLEMMNEEIRPPHAI
jgi:hypothetical protein